MADLTTRIEAALTGWRLDDDPLAIDVALLELRTHALAECIDRFRFVTVVQDRAGCAVRVRAGGDELAETIGYSDDPDRLRCRALALLEAIERLEADRER